jgi:hypothetical protein
MNNGSGSGRGDPDPDSDTDRNESTNVPISKLRIETKPKRFDVFLLLFCKSKTFPKILEQNQKFFMCYNFFIIQNILDLKENFLVR